MDASQFDSAVRAIAGFASRRSLFGLAVAGSLASLWPGDGRARKPRKKKCGPCEKRKRDKCKPKPDGLVCGEGSICRKGRCECEQPCGSDRVCLANGSCARVCPESFDCGTGCGCGLVSVEGPIYCIVSEGGCETFTQGCESSAECPIGQMCMTTFCAQAPINRCISLCPNGNS